MKRAWLVLALAVALTFMLAAPALADHSPTFFVEWDADASHTGYVAPFGNAGTGSPHQNYLEGTEKCGVCHSVHRAPVAKMKWDTNPADPSVKTAVAGGQYNRAEWESISSGNTQMLLMSDVANSCNYCHVSTAIGGDQLYAGSVNYINSTDAFGTDEWDEGFGHHNGCTGCHAVHGANSLGMFKGPISTKVLKAYAKGGAPNAAMDEVYTIGTAGAAELANSTIPGMAAWGAAATPGASVDPKNVPLFPSYNDMLAGTNVRPGTDAYDAQSGAFCTYCHQNYGYASEATVNPEGTDRSLFQGPWYVDGTVVGAPAGWVGMGSVPGQNAPFKNHPVKSIDGTFTAAGKANTVPTAVAYVGAETCVSCHDAGQSSGDLGVLIQSYPHFTPGYFHFVKSASHAGGTMTNVPPIPEYLTATDTAGLGVVQAWLDDPINYEEAVTVQDGQCLKCHVNGAESAGVGINF